MISPTTLVVVAFYTLMIVGTIYYYEDKLAKMDLENKKLYSSMITNKSQYEHVAWHKDNWSGNE